MADIELVIKIPEKEFGIDIEDKFQDFFKRLEVETKEHMISGTNLVCGNYELETIQMFIQAFANGTLLSKGHGDLIDRQELLKSTLCKTFGLRSVDIENTPTIIEADRSEEE